MVGRQVEFSGGLFDLPVFEALVFSEPLLAQLRKQLDAPFDLKGMHLGLLNGPVQLTRGVLGCDCLFSQTCSPCVPRLCLGEAFQRGLTLLQ